MSCDFLVSVHAPCKKNDTSIQYHLWNRTASIRYSVRTVPFWNLDLEAGSGGW